MKVLVTGCAGFIGSHLVDKLLKLGYEVIGIDCFTDYYARKIKERNIEDAMKNSDFVFMEKDILDAEFGEILNDVGYVFHEAAQAGVRKSWGEEFNIYTDNNRR